MLFFSTSVLSVIIDYNNLEFKYFALIIIILDVNVYFIKCGILTFYFIININFMKKSVLSLKSIVLIWKPSMVLIYFFNHKAGVHEKTISLVHMSQKYIYWHICNMFDTKPILVTYFVIFTIKIDM